MTSGRPAFGTTVALAAVGACAAFLVVSILAGEPRHFNPGAVTAPSIVGFLYLVTFGSLVGFTAYIYLLGATTPAKASTYAYVNPVVAVVLGWAVAGEPLTPRMLVAAAIILGGVALITLANTRSVPPATKSTAIDDNEHFIKSRPEAANRRAG